MSEEPAAYLSKDYDEYSLHWSADNFASSRPVVVGPACADADGAFAIDGQLTTSPTRLSYVLELWPSAFDSYYWVEVPYRVFKPLSPDEKLDLIHDLIENRDREMTWMSYGLWKSTKELFPHKDFGTDRK